MISQVSKIIIVLSFFWVFTGFISRNEKVKLRVRVDGLVVHKGQVCLAVYNSKEKFMKYPFVKKKFEVDKIGDGILIGDLSPGEYAITLFQDINENGKLEKMFSIPLEPYGVSNNPEAYPSYGTAKFNLKMDSIIHIRLKN